MADLIKKIKIKKQDGTFTDYIPIGADAANVETSDGESVQLKLNKKPYYYTNVASMKADTKLKAGDMAITLGYYEANDGGNGEYKIVNNSQLVDDGGSVHNLVNGLKAELISNSNNILKWGAYKNKSESSSVIIQKVIEYNKGKEIIIPSGTYYINEPIKTYASKDNFTNIIMDSDTIIKALTPVDYIFDLGGINETFAYEVGYKKYIKGGKIIATENVNIAAIKVEQKVKDLEMSYMFINCKDCNGLIVGDEATTSQDCFVHHVNIEHAASINYKKGLIVNSHDNTFSYMKIYYFNNAIETSGGSIFYNHIHTLATNLQTDTISFYVKKGAAFFSNCYGDSEDTFFKINSSASNVPYIFIENSQYYSYRDNKVTYFDLNYYARIIISNLYIVCKPGHEHIGFKIPYDSLDQQLSKHYLQVNGLCIENAEYMRDGDILKGLVSTDNMPIFYHDTTKFMDPNDWYYLGAFPTKINFWSNLEMCMANRLYRLPINFTISASERTSCWYINR